MAGDRPVPFSEIPLIFTNNPYAVYVISNLLSEAQPEELSVPEFSTRADSPPGTYWTLKGAPAPLPFDPYPDLPVYEISTNHDYLIDDRSVDYEVRVLMIQEAGISLNHF